MLREDTQHCHETLPRNNAQHIKQVLIVDSIQKKC
jgi:hypothetical protein